jgi:hypothetical protein
MKLAVLNVVVWALAPWEASAVLLRGGAGTREAVVSTDARVAFNALADPAIAALLGSSSVTSSIVSNLMRDGPRLVGSDAIPAALISSMPVEARAVVSSLPIFASTQAKQIPGSVYSDKVGTGSNSQKAAIVKGIATMNGMIAHSQVRLDDKTIECQETQTRNRETTTQVRNDIERLKATLVKSAKDEQSAIDGIQDSSRKIDEVSIRRTGNSASYV